MIAKVDVEAEVAQVVTAQRQCVTQAVSGSYLASSHCHWLPVSDPHTGDLRSGTKGPDTGLAQSCLALNQG